MPKQSRVKKSTPPPVRAMPVQIFERLCKLKNDLDERIDVVGDAAQGQINQLKKDLDVTQRALLEVESRCKQLQERMNSDFDDQDDEIEKISHRLGTLGVQCDRVSDYASGIFARLESVEDKLKVKPAAQADKDRDELRRINTVLTAENGKLKEQLSIAAEQAERTEKALRSAASAYQELVLLTEPRRDE